MKRLSIIVPMYKVGPYVERCLLSLEEQDIPHNEYEIICINDGSPDNSSEIVRDMQVRFDNIILLNQENKGVSISRNRGIDVASGEYLLMVDPDDYMAPNVLKGRLGLLYEHKLDVGLCGYIILDEAEREEYRYDPRTEISNVISGIEYFINNQKGRSEIRDPHRSWAIFFKANFLNRNKLRYLPGVPYLEDGEFIARVRCLAKRVSFLNTPFYLRTTRPGSATHSNLVKSDSAREGFVLAAINLMKFRNDPLRTGEQQIFLNQSIIHFTSLYITTLSCKDYFYNYSELYKKLKDGPLRKLEIEGCSRLYSKIGRYYNRSIHHFALFWIVFRIRKSFEIRLQKMSRVYGKY